MWKISALLLKWLGWKIENNIPPDLKKYVVAVAPHTSNWDFLLGLLVRSAIQKDIRYIGKHTLFKFPYGFIFYWFGGYPVDRRKSANMVDAVVQIFKEHERFAVAIAPEGTRKKVEKLKTGFYHIAKKAGVPIILTRLDFATKIVTFSSPFYPTEDIEADFSVIHNFFRSAVGKIPEYSFTPS